MGQSETLAEVQSKDGTTGEPASEGQSEEKSAAEAVEGLDADEAVVAAVESGDLGAAGGQGEEAIDPAAAEVVAAQNAQLAARDTAASSSSTSGQAPVIPAANIVPLISIQFSDPAIDYATLTKEQGYQAATVTVQGIGGMEAVPGQMDFTAADAQVKIRGNTTSLPSLKKRPLNIKFTSKQGLLGMPEGKTWVLLADAFDATMLRNYLALDLARAMGIPGTAEHRMVQVMVNGQHKGVFELTQQAKKLVKVDTASGGFVVEAVPDSADETGVTYLRSSPSGINFELTEPDPATADQKAAVQAKLNEVDAAICSGDWNRVQAVVDTASFAKMYVLQEYVKNFDQVNSFFFYWQDGKLHSGMPWDFDLSQGNVNPGIGGDYYTGSGSRSEAYSGIWHMGQGVGRGHWFDDLIKYQGFYDQVMAAWKDAQVPIAEKDSAQAVDVALATYGEVLKGNYQEDGGPWDINEYIDFRRGTEKTFGDAINYLKNYLTQRKAWLDQNLATELEKKVQYKDAGPVAPDNPVNPVQPTKLPTPTSVRWDAPDRTANATDNNATSQASAFWDTGTSGRYGVQVLKDGTTVVGQGITDENGFDFPVKQAGTYTFKVCAYPSDSATELQSDVVDSGTQQNGTLVTVSMNLDGGKLPDGAPSVAVAIKGQGAGVLPTPGKDGYTFEGWKKTDGSNYDPAAALSAPEAVTAQWKVNPPVKLPAPTDVKWEVPTVTKAGGATVMNAEATWTDPTSDPCQFGIQVYRDGKAYGASGLVGRDGVEVPLTQAGEYTFEVCTYPDKGDTGKTQSDPVKSADQPNGTLETVTFEVNGGTLGAGCPQIVGVIKGTPVATPAAPTRDGYDFKGWQKDGADYNFGSNVDAPIVLTAQWRADAPATKIDVPAAVGGLVYDGGPQTGVEPGA
ncbi:CotH kinase family protein, partial [Atopobiaceae bacterium 24-176]